VGAVVVVVNPEEAEEARAVEARAVVVADAHPAAVVVDKVVAVAASPVAAVARAVEADRAVAAVAVHLEEEEAEALVNSRQSSGAPHLRGAPFFC
jgi:hypothetical protein